MFSVAACWEFIRELMLFSLRFLRNLNFYYNSEVIEACDRHEFLERYRECHCGQVTVRLFRPDYSTGRPRHIVYVEARAFTADGSLLCMNDGSRIILPLNSSQEDWVSAEDRVRALGRFLKQNGVEQVVLDNEFGDPLYPLDD